MYIISGCLLGIDCKYNGGNNLSAHVKEFAENRSVFAVCPETLGGLESPREPSEQVNGKVLSRSGTDLTEEFRRGAEAALAAAECEAERRGEKIEGAILKANSPSCGKGKIYDGTFSGKLVEGDGVFAKILAEAGIKVITEKENTDDRL